MAVLSFTRNSTANAVLASQEAASASRPDTPDAWVEISIEYKGVKLIFPTNPEEIEITRKTQNFLFNVLELGEIVLPNTPDLERISFKSQFWAERAPQASGEYIEQLNKWRDEKEPGRIVIVSEDEEGSYHGKNALVLCDGFDTNEGRAGAEDDVYYTLNLVEYRENAGSSRVDAEDDPVTGEVFIMEPEPSVVEEGPPAPSVYTVLPGDSLWAITRKYGQPGTAWRELYEIPENKSIIGANPNLIYPGQQLIIPGSFLNG